MLYPQARKDLVIPITVVSLAGLFCFQAQENKITNYFFGPLILLWFIFDWRNGPAWKYFELGCLAFL